MTAWETRIGTLTAPKWWLKLDDTSAGSSPSTEANAGSFGSWYSVTATGSTNGCVAASGGISNTYWNFPYGNDSTNGRRYLSFKPTSGNDNGAIFQSPFTIEFWFKMPDYNSGNSTNYGIFNINASNASPKLYAHVPSSGNTDAGKLKFIFASTAATTEITSTSIVANNAWHHVVYTYGGSANSYRKRLYIDGTQQGSDDTTNPGSYLYTLFDRYSSLIIGQGVYGAATESYKGYLDEFLIYGYELTSTQVSGNYSAGAAIAINYSAAVMTASATSPNATWSAETVINKTYSSGVVGTASADIIYPTSSTNVNLDAFGVVGTSSSLIVNPTISVEKSGGYTSSTLTASALMTTATPTTTKAVDYSASPATASALLSSNVYYGSTIEDTSYELQIRKINNTTSNTDGKNGFVIGTQYDNKTVTYRQALILRQVTGVPPQGTVIKAKFNPTHVGVSASGDVSPTNTFNIYVFDAAPTSWTTVTYTNLPAKTLISTSRLVDDGSSEQFYLDLTAAAQDSRAYTYGIFIEHVATPESMPTNDTYYDRTEFTGSGLDTKLMYILTTDFVNKNINASTMTASATNTDVSIYVEKYVNFTDGIATASGLMVYPTITTEKTITVIPLYVSASVLSVMPVFSGGDTYSPIHMDAFAELLPFTVSTISNINIQASVSTVSALIEMPEAQIGEDNLVSHMDASALFVMPLIVINRFIAPLITTASSTMIHPAISTETKGAYVAQAMTVKAFLPTPPASINDKLDMWYSTLYAQDIVGYDAYNPTYLTLFSSVNTNLYPWDNTKSWYYGEQNTGNSVFPVGIGSSRDAHYVFNEYQAGIGYDKPKLEVGYFDDQNRRAVRITNISFGSQSKNSTAVGRDASFTAEFIIKTTKQNQIISHGWSDNPSTSYYSKRYSTLGIFNGKFYASRNAYGSEKDHHPLNYSADVISTGFTIGTKDVADGNWHHIVLQYGADPTRFQIWVDGELDVQKYLQGFNLSLIHI